MVEPLVVGDEQESFAVFVESTDRISLFGKNAERGQCGALSDELGKDPVGFVKDKVSGQEEGINFRNLHSRSGNPPVWSP